MTTPSQRLHKTETLTPDERGRALLDILRTRRSRRFGLGMKMAEGPFAYTSRHAPVRLTEEEEAMLAFAACGITGYAMADLCYAPGQGATILAGLLGRTIPSGDAIQTVSLIISNDEATYLLKRPQDFARTEIPELVQMAAEGDYIDLYRRSRVKIKDGRAAPPLTPLINLNVNQWSLYPPGCTYFLPVNEFTFIYINGMLELFDEATEAYVLDERAAFQPAGLKRFARSKGGHLEDDPKKQKVITVQSVETLVTEFVTIEQGMMIQNLALMTEALGLGGFPHWGAHPFGWFEALGFHMGKMRASHYLGMNRAMAKIAGWLGRDQDFPYVQGLEKDGKPLLTPYCPPYYPTMEAAVRAVVETKFGAGGTYRDGARHSHWREPSAVSQAAKPPSEAAIEATIAYCEYIYRRYGRFPAYSPPLRTVLGFQVNHVDVEFYDRFYHPEAVSAAVRQRFDRWQERDEGSEE